MTRPVRPPLARLGLVACLAAATPGAAAAQDGAALGPLVVSAVDTPEGSRLSVPLGDAGFEIAETGDRQLDVSVFGPERDLDLRQINLGGSARRILSAREVLSSGGTRFRLVLDCDCAARSRLNQGVLTIDIAAAFPDQTVRAPMPNEPAPGGTRFAPRWAPAPPPRGRAGGAEAAAASPVEAPAIGDADVAIARESLLRQLTRAADQGLLTFQSEEARSDRPITPSGDMVRRERPEVADAGPPQSAGEGAAPAAVRAEGEDAAAPPPPMASPALETAVRARTALDFAFDESRADSLRPPEPCPDPKLTALPERAEPGRFFEASAELRRGIVDDFGHVQPKGVETFARHYIAHGFGAEALIVLSTLRHEGGPPARIQALNDMARIVEGETPGAAGPFARWAVCGGPFRLWAEAGGLMRGAWALQPDYADQLVAAVNDARPALRNLLGAAILRSRLNQGDLDTTRRIDDILRRTAGMNNPGLALERARLTMAGGGSAEAALASLIEDDTPHSPAALLALAASYGPKRPPPPGFAVRLSDAARQARGGPDARALLAADIRITAMTLGAPAALKKVGEAIDAGRAPRQAMIDAGHAAIEIADPFGGGAERARDAADYARAIIEYAPFISSGRDGDAARTQAAAALTQIGLPALALALAEGAEGAADPMLAAATETARRALAEAGGGTAQTATGETDAEVALSDAGADSAEPDPGASAEGDAEGELENAIRLLNSASETRKQIEEALAADG